MNVTVEIDPNALAAYEAEGGDPHKRTLRLDLGVGPFEIEVRKLEEHFHTMPSDPARPATLPEVARLIHHLAEKLRA